jgi:cystathionine beta-lyase/cystathionine gamma-synthase
MLQEKRPNPVPETLAPHAGDWDINHPGQPMAMPLYQTTVFGFDSIEEASEVFSGTGQGWVYYRDAGPNQSAFEQAMAALEGAEAARATGSGMAAIFTAVTTAAQVGDHILADKVIYGVSVSLFTKQLPRFGIEVSFVDFNDEEALRAAIRPNTKALYFETLSNPLLGVANLAGVAKIAREYGLVSIIDSTFATPYLARPLEFGIDVVVHATTKYIGGHSDATGGMLLGSAAFIKEASASAKLLGFTLSPFDAWLNVRSLKTLPLRMQAHSRSALQVAEWLEKHPMVEKVNYPGLKSFFGHELAVRQMPRGFGGMLSFELKGGDYEMVSKFVKALQHIPYVPSLADVITTITYPTGTSHRLMSPEERLAMGVRDNLLRISVGIEDAQDIIADLEQAFRAI